MRLGDAVERFLAGYFATRERSEKTFKAYACDLRQLVEHVGKGRKLATFGPDEVEEYAAHLKRKGYAPASMQRKMVSLRVFFQYWARRETIPQSPFWRLRLSFGRSPQLPRTLTEGEVERLLGQARRLLGEAPEHTPGSLDAHYLTLRNFALVDLLLATGIRVGEAASLHLDSLSLEEKLLRVRGKGRRPRLAYLVDEQSLSLQRRHLAVRRVIPSETSRLFLNVFGSGLSTQGMANALKKLSHGAGIERNVTPHMLRHTAATLLLRNGVDLRVVQEFLGHASILSTQRYTHLTPRDIVSSLERLVRSSPKS